MNVSTDIRGTLHIIAEQLPEEATWDDAIERLQFLKKIAEGKKAASEGDFADKQEVARVIAKYGVKA